MRSHPPKVDSLPWHRWILSPPFFGTRVLWLQRETVQKAPGAKDLLRGLCTSPQDETSPPARDSKVTAGHISAKKGGQPGKSEDFPMKQPHSTTRLGIVVHWRLPLFRLVKQVPFRTPFNTGDGRNPAPPKKPWSDASPVNTNKQWCAMVSKWCRFSSTHSM